MIFVAPNVIILEPNFWLWSCYVKSNFGEFTMILSLLEILNPQLCMFLIIKMCSMFHKSYVCVC
jgi:hypothetical protein